MRVLIRLATCAIVGAVLFGCFTTGAWASQGPLDGLDRYIEEVRADWKSVGIAVAVVRNSEVIYARGFGHREIGKRAAVDADTLFQVGSTSKAFTAAALGMLVDEGSIHWDDPVIRYLPGFEVQDPWLTRNLTIRDALTHRSGILERYYFALGRMDAHDAVSQLRYVAAEGAFRDSYRYSNLMYEVASEVIEAASGMSWHEFMKRRLLQPLKMTRSGTSPYEFWDARFVAPTFLGSAPAGEPESSDARDANVAMPHGWDENGTVVALPWRSYDNAAGAGAIVSSASDMANWLILHLNAGRFEGRQLLKPRTLEELHAVQNLHAGTSQFPFEQTGEAYAMAWRRAQYRGRIHLAHSGGVLGFPAYVALLPDDHLGIVVLSNGPKLAHDDYSLHKAIAFHVFDLLLGPTGRDWRAEFLGRLKTLQAQSRREEEELVRARLPNAPPSLALQQYAGSYEDRVGHSGPVSVRLENGRLRLSFAGEGAFSAFLDPWHHDLFRLRPDPAVADALGPKFAAFTVGPAGGVVSMSVFEATFQPTGAALPTPTTH